MKKLLLVVMLVLAGSLFAQDDWSFKWSGMVSPQIWADSRQVVSGREDMMAFYPMPINRDANGKDVNAVPSLNMLSITARMALTVTGPDVLGAKVRGYIETDFTGANNETVNMLRLRHGYLDLKWEHSELLAGQFWHPMVVHEIMPGTRPLNMGAPFHPYGRYNQLRYTGRLGRMELVAVADFQTDNKSQGPLGSSTAYLKHSMIPESNLQLRYAGEHFFAGAAANLLATKPYAGETGRESYNSHISYSLFMKYDFSQWSLRSQCLINSNIYEASSLGGYAVATDPLTGLHSYTPYTFTTAWADFGRTAGRWRPGLFVGFGQNNDFGERYGLEVYGRGVNIERLYRLQPRLAYAAGNGLTLFLELEHTAVDYGRQNVSDPLALQYESDKSCHVVNNRIVLAAAYVF